jgi:hypothetical protein
MKSRVLLIVIVLAAFCSTGWVAHNQAAPSGWEYKIVPSYLGTDRELSATGLDGWELVTVVRIESSNQGYLYFKRRK